MSSKLNKYNLCPTLNTLSLHLDQVIMLPRLDLHVSGCARELFGRKKKNFTKERELIKITVAGNFRAECYLPPVMARTELNNAINKKRCLCIYDERAILCP